MLRSLTFWFTVLAFTSSAAFAVPCTQVALKPDQGSIVLPGKTTGSDTDVTCLRLATAAGRSLHFKLARSAGPPPAFNIDDVIENRDDYSFVTSRDSYDIKVYELFRASSPQPFQIFVAASPSEKGADTGNPADTVSAVVNLDDRRSSLFNFGDQPTPLMRKYFTADFIGTWVVAMRHDTTEPVLDGDPLTGLQGVKAVTLGASQTNLISGDDATVTARVAAQPDGSTFTKPEEQNLHLHMKRENGVWKIDDISSSGQPSLHTYLSRFK